MSPSLNLNSIFRIQSFIKLFQIRLENPPKIFSDSFYFPTNIIWRRRKYDTIPRIMIFTIFLLLIVISKWISRFCITYFNTTVQSDPRQTVPDNRVLTVSFLLNRSRSRNNGPNTFTAKLSDAVVIYGYVKNICDQNNSWDCVIFLLFERVRDQKSCIFKPKTRVFDIITLCRLDVIKHLTWW